MSEPPGIPPGEYNSLDDHVAFFSDADTQSVLEELVGEGVTSTLTAHQRVSAVDIAGQEPNHAPEQGVRLQQIPSRLTFSARQRASI